MAKRHCNHRRVKIHRTYSVEEIADLFGIHKNTVRAWIKTGLPTIDTTRPLLVHGKALVEFLVMRRTKNKRPCQPNELYCLRCRVPRKPAGGMVDYIPLTANSGNLSAICPVCETIMNRRVSLARLPEFQRYLDITIPLARRHITERGTPSVMCDLL